VRQPVDSGAWLTLSIRTPGDPQPSIATVQKRLRSLGPDIHIIRTGTLARQMGESLLEERLISTLAAAFGLLALLLSAVGLYGVLAYSVARWTSEIGIRMALGAMPGPVTWTVLRQTLWLVVIGLAAGVARRCGLSGELSTGAQSGPHRSANRVAVRVNFVRQAILPAAPFQTAISSHARVFAPGECNMGLRRALPINPP